jgi:hypothetical protein
MSKQPDKELRAELYELLKSDKRADTYVIPHRVMDIFVEYFTKAQLQLVDELMASGIHAERASYKSSDHDGITNWPIITRPMCIIPIEVLQQYKANLSRKGE